MTSSELIELLEQIEQDGNKAEQKYARLCITEVIEDEIDRGGPFILPAPAREYVSELMPPPHIEWKRLPADR